MVTVPAKACGRPLAGTDRLWLVRWRINQRHLVFFDALNINISPFILFSLKNHSSVMASMLPILRVLIMSGLNVTRWHRSATMSRPRERQRIFQVFYLYN